VKSIPFSSSARPLAGEFRAQRISPSLPHDKRTRNRLSENLLSLVQARENRRKPRYHNDFAGFPIDSPQAHPRLFLLGRMAKHFGHAQECATFELLCDATAKFSMQVRRRLASRPSEGEERVPLATRQGDRPRAADGAGAATDRPPTVPLSVFHEPISKSRQHIDLPKH
jgi:hypothetical protein